MPFKSTWSGTPSSVDEIVERLNAEDCVTAVSHVDHELGFVTILTPENADIERVRELLAPLGWWQGGSSPMDTPMFGR